MDIPAYISEVEYCTAAIIPLIWHEHAELAEIRNELEELTQAVESQYRQSESIALNAEDPDDVAMATGMYWDTYFGDDKDRHEKSLEASALQSRIDARAFSVGSLCGSLLQIAKQGISVVHGALSQCPNGRDVKGHNLKDVIWQGRNQSIHWEEGSPHPPVQALFDSLAANVDSTFGDYRSRNCAFDIISLLGWKAFDDFKADMTLLQ